MKPAVRASLAYMKPMVRASLACVKPPLRASLAYIKPAVRASLACIKLTVRASLAYIKPTVRASLINEALCSAPSTTKERFTVILMVYVFSPILLIFIYYWRCKRHSMRAEVTGYGGLNKHVPCGLIRMFGFQLVGCLRK